MNDRQLADAVWAELTQTTDSYPQWRRKGFPAGTHWAKAKAFNDQIGVAPPANDLEGLWEPGTVAERWYNPVPAAPQVAADSAARVAQIGAADGLVLGKPTAYGVPCFTASASQPNVPVTVTGGPHTGTLMVPIPAGAYSATGSDGHMTVIQASCMWDFWKARKDSSGHWTAAQAHVKALPAPGVFAGHASCRGSGVQLQLGLVRPQEIAAGRIPHALLMFAPQGNMYDAAFVNQASGDAGGIPNGCRFFVPRSVDVNALTQSATLRLFAQAAQEFGIVMADGTNGSFVQVATEYQGVKITQYLPDEYVRLDFLLPVLEMMKPGTLTAHQPESETPSSCAVWA